MASDATNAPGSGEVKSDEAWKERVKAEDAARDHEFQAQSAATDEASPDEPAPDQAAVEDSGQQPELPPLPPPDFAMLVSMFSTQAMVGLGLLPNPATGTTEPQPELARHFIDLLGVLEEKTKGNLDAGEQSLLDSSLHQLRIVYIEQTARR